MPALSNPVALTRTMPQKEPVPAQPATSVKGRLVKACFTVLALMTVCVLCLLWIYQVESHHSNRDSIWWPSRGRSLIPPAATDITLQRDLLDHPATYKVSEADLNAFLDERFARQGENLDSYSERSGVDREWFMRAYADLGWVWREGMVQYHYTTSNGAASAYYHDPTTGLTYQVSAYW